MGIPIPGANRAQFDSTTTEAATGTRPFPFIAGKWLNYTARVDEVSIAPDNSGAGNDQLLIKASNGAYAVRFYLNLDPSNLGPTFSGNRDEATQKNLDRLTKAAKCLDIATWTARGMEIEPKQFHKAEGKIISFGIIHATNQATGKPAFNAKGYPKPSTNFNGLHRVQELEPVVEPLGFQQQSPAPSQGSRPLPPTGTDPLDIPF